MTSSDAGLPPLELIRNKLLNIAGSEQTGAQLRALIDVTCPDFDLRAAVGMPTGPGALTKFLNDHFADIVHAVGKHGGDTLYSIGEPGLSSASRSGAGGGAPMTSLWAVFASPGLRQQLVFDRAVGQPFVHPQGAPTSEEQVPIPPVSHDEFRVMAENFIDTVPPDLKKELQKILNEPDFIYDNWISILRVKYPSHHHRWGLYRVQAIIDLFRQRLAEAGIPQDQLEVTVRRLAEAQSATYKERLLAHTRTALYGGAVAWERQEVRTPPQALTSSVAESRASIDPRSLASGTGNQQHVNNRDPPVGDSPRRDN